MFRFAEFVIKVSNCFARKFCVQHRPYLSMHHHRGNFFSPLRSTRQRTTSVQCAHSRNVKSGARGCGGAKRMRKLRNCRTVKTLPMKKEHGHGSHLQLLFFRNKFSGLALLILFMINRLEGIRLYKSDCISAAAAATKLSWSKSWKWRWCQRISVTAQIPQCAKTVTSSEQLLACFDYKGFCAAACWLQDDLTWGGGFVNT